jgi:uncharacterized protein (TIGR02246 family)
MSISIRRALAFGGCAALAAAVLLLPLSRDSVSAPPAAGDSLAQNSAAKPAAKSGARPAATPAPSTPATDHAADEQAIRAAAAAYVKAYNAGDAKTIAAMFTAQGRVVDATGRSVRGRDEIERLFAKSFADAPGVQIENNVDVVEFLHPSVALEEGHAILTHGTSGFVEDSGYSAIHVKEGNKWLISLARDWPEEASSAELQLRQLAWLVGDWVDESSASAIASSYKLAADGMTILGESTVHMAGKPVMTVTTRIGWNPAAEQVHSWVFDSEGGFAQGDWTREGDRWTARMSGVTGKGELCNSTNIITRLSPHTWSWQSVDRIVGGNAAPDIGISVNAKKPPAPQ